MTKETYKSIELVPSYEEMSSWWEHVPVAHWLMEVVQPKVVVELGTHYGVSFFSFCESAEIFSKDSFIYAIDTWEGDNHAGLYSNEVYNKVKRFQETNYSTISRMIRSTFEDGALHFSDNSIDLIHIDGLHTYEAVKHDFNLWESKLKEGGTLLFHDWNVREGDFGVWRLWEDIKECGNYQCIEIKNGHGLGVATLTQEKPKWHSQLVEYLPVLRAKGTVLDRASKYKMESEKSKIEKIQLKEELDNLRNSYMILEKHTEELNKIINHQRQSWPIKLFKKLLNPSK